MFWFSLEVEKVDDLLRQVTKLGVILPEELVPNNLTITNVLRKQASFLAAYE